MSDYSDLRVERATPDDSGKAGELIYSTGVEFFNFLFFNDKKEILLLLSQLFSKNSGIFSFKFATVAKNDDGIMGLVLGYGKNKEELHTLINGIYIVLKSSPQKVFNILIRDYIISRFFRKIYKDSYYIAHLAVDDEFRHHGIGGMLLNNAIENARKMGYSYCSLDVSVNNQEAFRLYKAHEFEVINEVRFPTLEKKHKLPGQYRMLKKIK